MRHLKNLGADLLAHRLAAALFLAWWLAAWAITVATWLHGPTGEPEGMHPLAVALHSLLPLAAGGLVCWWRGHLLHLTAQRALLAVGCACVVGLLAVPLPEALRIALAAVVLMVVATLAGVRGLGASTLAGLLVLESDLALLTLGGGLLFGGAGGTAPATEQWLYGLLEVLEWGVFLGVYGLFLGWLGGFLVGFFATIWRHGRPAAPTPV